MVSNKEMVVLLDDWMIKVDISTKDRDANALCESTRMMLAFAIILHTYFPETLTEVVRNQMRSLFSEATLCVDSIVEENHDTDGCLDLYHRNIHERHAKFEELDQTWWGVTART